MVEHVLPLIRKHNVNILLTGHSHNFQYASLDLDTHSQEQVMAEYEEKLNIGECVEEYGEFYGPGEEGVHETVVTRDNTLHSFVVGAAGKHGLESICNDYSERLIGHFHYGHNPAPSFGVAQVTAQYFQLQIYATAENQAPELIYTFRIEEPNDLTAGPWI